MAFHHVKGFQPKFPGLLEVRTGNNLDNPDSYGYTHGFIMQYIDETHMKAYFDTPDHDHQAVREDCKRGSLK